ncbi:hypothetical protein CL629_00385 [bacterium]|nr:hypothetical protein [bacterium]
MTNTGAERKITPKEELAWITKQLERMGLDPKKRRGLRERWHALRREMGLPEARPPRPKKVSKPALDPITDFYVTQDVVFAS